MPDPVRIAAFDLDNTVLRGDSHLLFLRYLALRGQISPTLLIEVAFFFVLHALGIPLDVPKHYARFLFRSSGMDREQSAAAMRGFALTLLHGRVRQQAREAMARARADGCHVVLLSASLEPIVAVVAGHLDADGFVGTRLGFDAVGKFTVEGELVYGDAKVRALQRYADERFPAWRLEQAFGNDYGDRFLLEGAAIPVAVCPSARLRAVANQRGWTSITWR